MRGRKGHVKIKRDGNNNKNVEDEKKWKIRREGDRHCSKR